MSEIFLHSGMIFLLITIIASLIRAIVLFKEGSEDSVKSITKIAFLKNPRKANSIKLSNVLIVIVKIGIALGAISIVLSGFIKEIGVL